MKKKWLLYVPGLLALMVILTACGVSGGSDGLRGVLSGLTGRGGRELRMNVTTSGNSVWHVAADTFRDLIEERTNGRYRVHIYPDEQLSDGDVVKGVENLFSGAYDLDIHCLVDMQSYEEKLAVVCLPWLFADYEQVDETIFTGPGRDDLFDLIRDNGAEPLALGENGFRQLTNNRRTVSAPSDLRGLQIRTPPNDLIESIFRTFGAEPVSMDWEETFPVLQSDGLDGQENSLDAVYSAQIHAVQKYTTVWNCVYDPICFSASGDLWASLNADDRAIFRACAEEACAAEIQASRAAESDTLRAYEESGVEVITLSRAQMEMFRDAAQSLYTQWRERLGDRLCADFGVHFP